MGTTFSNIHIYKNNCVTGKDVSEFLFELMKQKGFVESKQENADISFSVLSFPDSDWITVCDNYNVFEDKGDGVGVDDSTKKFNTDDEELEIKPKKKGKHF